MLKNTIRLLLGTILIFGFIGCGESSSSKHENVVLNTFKIDFLEYEKVKISWDRPQGSTTYKVKYFTLEKAVMWEVLPYEEISSPSITVYPTTEEEWMIAIKPNNGTTWTLTKFGMNAYSGHIYIAKDKIYVSYSNGDMKIIYNVEY